MVIFNALRGLTIVAVGVALVVPLAGASSHQTVTPTVIAQLGSANGSAVGPGGDLYITQGSEGIIWRVDRQTGQASVYASGLPKAIVGLGGVMDVEFIGNKAYALVTLVGADVGGQDVVGIYRIDGPSTFTVIADIGAFSAANPPSTPYQAPTGVQYALESYRGGFLVTDGHHNRVLSVTLDGAITQVLTLSDVVPTGLSVGGRTVYVAQAGPVPHLAQDGQIISLDPTSGATTVVGSGAAMLVDVEFGRGQLYAVSQGVWDGAFPGSPALPNTGALVRLAGSGFVTVSAGLDRPTSVEIVGSTAYVVGLGGAVYRIGLNDR